jgi:hypothetical protein
MPDEHLVLDGHALTEETMRGYLTARADLRADLDFDEPANPRLVTYRAAEKIHEIRMKDPHVAAELNVLCYGRRIHHLFNPC